jgi:superfamily II DNA or RNA helicase
MAAGTLGPDIDPWEHLDAGSPLRTYQRRALEELLLRLEPPGARTCLVAPPGAGKTRVAIHAAAALRRPVEVRVPTTTLVHQWEARIADNLVSVLENAEAPVRVSTYAGMGEFAAGALVILDEAHHLLKRWGEEVLERLSPEHRVLGLTATPPEGSAGWERFLEVVGTDPVVVEAPPLVRDGHLCPYQDLVWPVLADPDDVPQLQAAHQALRDAERTLGDDLTQWTANTLQEDLWQLTEDRFAKQQGLLVSLCRFRHALGRSLPNDLPPDPEFLEPPTLHDRAMVMWAYDPESAVVRTAVRDAGFRRAGKGLLLREDLAWRSLSASRARIRGAIDVLSAEHAARADGLRALVMTDRDTEGGRLSAREILRALVSDRRTDALDPILVTGTAFWVDDDLWPRIADRLPPLPWRVVGDHHEVDTTSWSTAERVALATRLLTEGTTRCLVGTRHLLGEGWDCPALNCVIDLTGIVAPVTVNQVRGRALRQDPNDPSKVASIWDVIALVPGLSGGGGMLDRLQRRHAHTLGIDSRGRIRAGVSRIDPALAGSPTAVATAVPEIQARMSARADDVVRTAQLWSVGQGYKDRRVWRVEGRPPAPTRLPRMRLKKPLAAGKSAWIRRRNLRVWGTMGALGILGGGASVLAGAVTTPFLGPLATGVTTLGLLATLSAMVAAQVIQSSRLDRHLFILRALGAAFAGVAPDAEEVQLDGTRAWMEGPASARFAEATAELLGAVRYPRYLLLEPNGQVWPVPAELGATRDLADAFARAWADHVGPCEVVYARRGRGRDLLVAAWKAGGRDTVQVIEDWE